MLLDPNGLAGGKTFSAVTNATSYEIEVSRSATVGGTYTVVGLGGITNTLEHRHICNPSWFYKARVRARNAYGQPGTWTSLSSAVQPAAKGTATLAAPTNIAVNAIALGYKVNWDAPSKTDYFFSEIAVKLVAGTPASTEIVAMSSNTFTSFFWPYGTQNPYYIYVRHVDTSGNKTSWVAYGAPTAVSALTLGFGLVVDSTELTSTAVSDQMAAASVGDVGSYAYCKNTSGSTINAGGTIAGSSLVYSDSGLGTGAVPSGTWRCMGRCPAGAATMWLRIS